MLLKLSLFSIMFSISMKNLEANNYVWEYSLASNCSETCSRLEEFTEPVSTYKGDTQVCSKKSLFGLALKPGYKVAGEKGCLVADLRNKVFQCLCAADEYTLDWRDHSQASGSCKKTCAQWDQAPVLGDHGNYPVCATIVHDQEYSGHLAPNTPYCIAGSYTSTVAQCLCSGA
ncbi:MAG: hypothetical protein AB8G05_16940 [Oligoflexales bacterium]